MCSAYSCIFLFYEMTAVLQQNIVTWVTNQNWNWTSCKCTQMQCLDYISAGTNSQSLDGVQPNFENIWLISHYDWKWGLNISPTHLRLSSRFCWSNLWNVRPKGIFERKKEEKLFPALLHCCILTLWQAVHNLCLEVAYHLCGRSLWLTKVIW